MPKQTAIGSRRASMNPGVVQHEVDESEMSEVVRHLVDDRALPVR